MGGHPYWYFVPHKNDVQEALSELRDREFKAGRYNPVIRFIKFSEPAFSRQTPGPKHKTIDAAIRASERSTEATL
jgi:hypothetical protein